MTVSTDKSQLDLPMIFNFLHHQAYWSKGRSLELVERSIQNSLCFGLYDEDQQIGFARVVTDHAIFAWLMDVFVLPTHRGQGGGKKLLEAILTYPDLGMVKTWGLKTHDAHSLYEQYGFREIDVPQHFMERKIKSSL